MQTIKIATFKDLIDDGKIFGVQFVKKDGTVRNMQARTHVSALIKPATTRLEKGVRKAEDDRCGVLTVYDMAKVTEDDVRGAFRRINLKTINHVSVGGKKYKIEE